MSTAELRGSSDRSLLVLTSLVEGPKQGHALIKDIEAFAGVTLGPGTHSGSVPTGHIVSISPSAGSTVSARTLVTLENSLGPTRHGVRFESTSE